MADKDLCDVYDDTAAVMDSLGLSDVRVKRLEIVFDGDLDWVQVNVESYVEEERLKGVTTVLNKYKLVKKD